MKCEVITDKLIDDIEVNIFKSSIQFDLERRNFIKNLEKINISAAAGCGKTTTLIAKIKILEAMQPFLKGRGICILSHTNVAIDEANRILGNNSKIWKHPNYCGTIQKFIDNYLFKMIYNSNYKSKIQIIDQEVYCTLFYKRLLSINASHKYTLENKRFDPNKIEIYYNDVKYNGDTIKTYINRFIKKQHLITNYTNSVNQVIESLCQEGIYTYTNVFNYSISFLKKNPTLCQYFSSRFKYIFIDEAQDINKHQYEILKLLFDKSNIQYIGDTNQAIYNGLIWQKGDCINISKSHRLSKEIAEFASNFEIEKSGIYSDKKMDIPITFIIFNKDNVDKVVDRFEKIVNDYKLFNQNNKVIGRIKKYNDKGITLYSYCKEKINNNGNNFSKLSINYFLNFNTINNFYKGSLYKSIVDCLYYGLKLIYIKGINDAYLHKKTFNDMLNDKRFKKEIHDKILIIMQGFSLKKAPHEDIKKLINLIVFKFDINVKQDDNYIQFFSKSRINKNIDSKLQINTIKGVKGETHCSTLLVDTYYNKFYHIDRVLQLFKEKKKKLSKQDQEFIREFYVAITRPQKLLCLAIERDTYTKHKDFLSMLSIEEIFI